MLVAIYLQVEFLIRFNHEHERPNDVTAIPREAAQPSFVRTFCHRMR